MTARRTDPAPPVRRSQRREDQRREEQQGLGPAQRLVGSAVDAVRRMSLAMKFGALGLVTVLALGVTTVVLINDANNVTVEYDAVLSNQVRQTLLARQVQVEFKKQVQEWKDILLRGANAQDLATYTANFRREDSVVNDLTEQLLMAVTEPDIRTQVLSFRNQHAALDASYQLSYSAFAASGGRAQAASDRMVRGKDRPPTAVLDQVITSLEASAGAGIEHRKTMVAHRQRLVLAIGLVVVLLLGLLLAAAVWRVVRPVRRLTQDADRAARESLPALIRQIQELPADADPPQPVPFDSGTQDELSDLASALTRLQASAVSLAVQQHRVQRESSEMLINLGRRNQNLLSRLLSQVTTLERNERDADALAELFRLDHAATRIRRNAESMLVLAGAAQTRTYSRPVPCVDAIRAALSEIEDYVRVELYHVEAGELRGTAAADVVHLLAELIENATHFSPPSAQVTVVGQRLREGYRIRISDQGVGMTRRELADANERILHASSGWTDAKLLGLYVVGRLATRRGIQVTLEPGATRGITATVLLPSALLESGNDPHGTVPQVVPVPSTPLHRPAAPRQSPPPQRPGLGTGPLVEPARVVNPWPVEMNGWHESSSTRAPHLRPVNGHAGPEAHPVPAGPHAVPAQGGPGQSGPAHGGPAQSGPGRAEVPTGLPVRVRGAQLAELGLDQPPLEVAFAPVPESSRWNLRNFQLDVEAARRAIAAEHQPAGDDDGCGEQPLQEG